jgi:AraC-like DNA-binding protein
MDSLPAAPLSQEKAISLRLVWPFIRVLGAHPEAMAKLQAIGIGLKEFAQADTRIPHRLVMQLLAEAVERTGDPTIGLKAAQQLGPADLDVLEYAGRSCATLRDAAECATRYLCLMNEAADTRLVERGDIAIWEFRVTDGVVMEPAANDFELAAYTNLARRHTGELDRRPIEVHFTHHEATSPAEYERVFGCPIRFDMPYNAIVFPRVYLDTPMVHADPARHAALSAHVSELLERQSHSEGHAARTREYLLQNVSNGSTNMPQVAKALAMSVATLRRRLEEESTSHSELLDQVRHELALRYLADSRIAISEVAFLLGFAHVAAFYKAFRRWTNGAAPADFRHRP